MEVYYVPYPTSMGPRTGLSGDDFLCNQRHHTAICRGLALYWVSLCLNCHTDRARVGMVSEGKRCDMMRLEGILDESETAWKVVGIGPIRGVYLVEIARN
jgi:hypothetical protein